MLLAACCWRRAIRRALGHFNDAVRRDPRQPSPWVRVAECDRAMGQIDAAQAALYRALELSPSDRRLRQSLRELPRVGPLRRLWRALCRLCFVALALFIALALACRDLWSRGGTA